MFTPSIHPLDCLKSQKRLLDLAVYVDDGGPEVLDRAIKSAFDTWKKGAEITGLKPQ